MPEGRTAWGGPAGGLPLALLGGCIVGGCLAGGGLFGSSLVLAGGLRGLGLGQGLGLAAGVLEGGVGGVLRTAAPKRSLEHPHRLLLRIVHRARVRGRGCSCV